MRKCRICGETKEDHWFDSTKGYFNRVCNDCEYIRYKERQLDRQLEKEYGISRAHWELILKAQDGKCKLCGKVFGGKIKIHVDHNHETQVVRGLLCHSCNIGLGHFGDDPERLRAAANYLETSNALKELHAHLHLVKTR